MATTKMVDNQQNVDPYEWKTNRVNILFIRHHLNKGQNVKNISYTGRFFRHWGMLHALFNFYCLHTQHNSFQCVFTKNHIKLLSKFLLENDLIVLKSWFLGHGTLLPFYFSLFDKYPLHHLVTTSLAIQVLYFKYLTYIRQFF